VHESSGSLLWIISKYLSAPKKKHTIIKHLILAKFSLCKGPMNECKVSMNELKKANNVHRNDRRTSTIHFAYRAVFRQNNCEISTERTQRHLSKFQLKSSYWLILFEGRKLPFRL
jgi:hypothetical protein